MKRMRCLVVREPLVSLIASGRKIIEMRGCRIANGDLVICGSLQTPGPFAGKTACVVSVDGCEVYDSIKHQDSACLNGVVMPYERPISVMMSNVRAVAPISVRGMPGIFLADVPE
jgi:hypothetical protein